MEIVNSSTDFSQHNLQLIIMLFPLKHLKLKIPDKLGQGFSSVSAVSHRYADEASGALNLVFRKETALFWLGFKIDFLFFNLPYEYRLTVL